MHTKSTRTSVSVQTDSLHQHTGIHLGSFFLDDKQLSETYSHWQL